MRIKKQAAYNLILNLDIDQNVKNDLLTYFAPAIPAKPKTTFQWVAKACGKKDIRFYLNSVYCDGNLVATDGRRLHIAYSVEHEHGYFEPRTQIKENISTTFPNYSRIMPKEDYKDLRHVDNLKLKVLNPKQSIYMLHGFKYDAKYVNDAFSGIVDPELYQTTTGQLLIKCKSVPRAAVIMPRVS